MRQISNLSLVLAFAVTATAARAAIITKADDTNSIDQGISWIGNIAPGAGDIATWSGSYSADPTTTNSLRAILPGGAISWQGMIVGSVSGLATTTNTFYAAATNIAAATEVSNLVTITTKAAHALSPSQAVTIAGVTPAGYNGTFIVVGVPSSTTFTFTNATTGLAAGTAFGTVQSAFYMGGLGAATAGSSLTIGTSGIDMSAANISVNLNAISFSFNGNQTWNIAEGDILHFGASGTGGANAKVLSSGNDGTITISGGGLADLNEGGDSGFTSTTSFLGFGGNWIVNSGATLRGLRNGPEAFGTGGITLNGGTLAVGGISGDVGNWTWNTSITLNSGTTNYMDDQNVTGTGRYLKLNEAITGAGNLVFKDTLGAFTSSDLGYILTGANNFTGTMTVGGPVENGLAGRLTNVRIGGSQTSPTDTGTAAGLAGTLGTGNVVNNGVLTFSTSVGLSVPNVISGSGTLRVGSTTANLAGTDYQTVTLLSANTYTGPTLVNEGTLAIGSTGSISNSGSVMVLSNAIFDSTALTAGFSVNAGQGFDLLGGTVNGNLNASPGSFNIIDGGTLNGNFTSMTGSATLIAPGGSNVVGTLYIGGNLALTGASNVILLDINASASDQISVGGNLTVSGVTTLQFVPPGTGVNAGTYSLITVAGTLAATPANFSVAGLVEGARPQTFNIQINNNIVQLVVVGSPGYLTWVGDGVSNVWNTATTSNWFNTVNSVKDVFYAGDIVIFDDSGSDTPAIDLVGNLQPGSITESSAQNYTFGGTGTIVGAGGLTMSGSGTLTLNASNDFTGPTTISSGTLLIPDEAALGTNPLSFVAGQLTIDGGILLTTNSFAMGNSNRGFSVGNNTGSGEIMTTNGTTLSVSNVISGSGSLVKDGLGTMILSGSNTFAGGAVINNGDLVYGSGQALGTGALTSGTSGYFVPPFTMLNGTVDIFGQSTYQPNFAGGTDANGTAVVLYNATLNFNGNPGAAMSFQDSGVVSSGWGSSAATVLNYNAGNNPGTLNISARFCSTGTSGASTRAFSIDDSTATTTEVNIAAPMGVLTLDPTNQDSRNVTIIKNGAGTLQISASNNFPIMEVDQGLLRVNHPLALGTDRSISTNASGGTGSPNQLVVTAGTVDLNGFSPAIGSLTDNAIGSGLILNNGSSASVLTLGWSISTVFNASYGSVIANGSGPVALNKIGTNIQTLGGVNTYSGPTTINNGALLISAPGQIGLGTIAGTVTVQGGSLGGTGTINAPVMVQAGGTLAPGLGAATTVTLTVTSNLTLNGSSFMNVDKDTGTNDLVVVTSGKITYGGTLAVSTNLMTSTTLALGDSFKLFSAPSYGGNFTYISGSPGPGLFWNFNPATGVASVGSVAFNPTNITFSFSSGTMTLSLSWPSSYLGWLLQAQTSATGLGPNWVDISGSATITSTNITVNPANPAVFFRLRHP